MTECTCNSAFGVDRCPFHGYAKGVSKSVPKWPHGQDYLNDLRHDLQNEEFAWRYLSACTMESGDALRIGIRDVFEALNGRAAGEPKAADSALDRASIPGMFNVIGDELRKLNEALSNMLKWHNEHECLLAAVHTIVCKQGAQLTALRAEADKAREEGANHYEAIHTKFMEVYKRLTSMENRMADLQLSVDAMHGPKRGDVTGSIRGIDVHVKALAEGLANSNRWQSEHECLLAAVHTLIMRQTKGTGRKKKQERKPGGRKSR